MHRLNSLSQAGASPFSCRLVTCVALASAAALVGCSDGSGRALVDASGSPTPGGSPSNAGAVPSPAEVFGALDAASLRLPADGTELDGVARTPHAQRVNSAANSLSEFRSLEQNPWFCPRPRGAVTLELTPGVYTPRNGYWFAWLALQGYGSRDTLQKLARVGVVETALFNDRATSLRGFVASSRDFTVLSFAGSGDVKDWINNLTFGQVRDDAHGVPGRVHQGFHQALSGSWNGIANEVVRQSRRGTRPVYVTGHSLGGAMAVLSAARLAAAGVPIAGVYLYATPRVGDETFAQHFDARLGSRTWRFNNNEDVIPHLAPAAATAGNFAALFPEPLGKFFLQGFTEARYEHVGALFRFDARGRLTGPHTEDLQLEDAFWKSIHARSDGKNVLHKALLNWRAIGDHVPASSFCYLGG